MYKYIFNFFLFYLLFFTDLFFNTDTVYNLAVAPAVLIGLTQAAANVLEKIDINNESNILDAKLAAAKSDLDNIEFINKLNALTVPKSTVAMQGVERAESSAVEALRESGQRGVANIPKAVQATNEALLNITEEDRRAQFLADKAVMENEQLIDTMNEQAKARRIYGEIYGLQQAGLEARNRERAANMGLFTGLTTAGIGALTGGLGGIKKTADTGVKNPYTLNLKPATIGNVSGQQGSLLKPATIGNVSGQQTGMLGMGSPDLVGFKPFTGLGTKPLGAAAPAFGALTGGVGSTQLNSATGGLGAGQLATNLLTAQPSVQPTGMKYGLDLSKGYDGLNLGNSGAILASNEYVPGTNAEADAYFEAYVQWHKETYGDDVDVTYAGEGGENGKLKEFERALGF